MVCKRSLFFLFVFLIMNLCAGLFAEAKNLKLSLSAENARPAEEQAEEFNGETIVDSPEEGNSNYYITKDENKNIYFVQKLSWNKIPDIKNYRIEIERGEEDGTWSDVLEKDINENKIEVSLPAGKYRFKVSVINLFDRLEKNSGWQNFEILKAIQPEISNTETASVYLDSKKADGIFTITGDNLTDSTVFIMENRNAEPPKIIYGKIIELGEDGKTARVHFELEQIEEGDYDIMAKNPGGLAVISKTIHIKEKKPASWKLAFSAGYACPFTFYDGTLDSYTENNFFPISATVRISVIPFHTKYGNFGFGAGGNYSRFQNESYSYNLSGNYMTALAFLVYQIPFSNEKFILDFHVGAGIACLGGTTVKNNLTGIESPKLNGAALAFGGGLGIQYHISGHFYVELAADFVHAKFKDMNVGMLYPSLSVGGIF